MAKKNKRGQGEGSIRERNDGSWEARYTMGVDSAGKQLRKSVYGKTSEEVKKKLRKVLTSIDEGTYIEPQKTTVSSWLDTWFQVYKKPSVKPKTLECYDNVIRKHLNPVIGSIALKDLRPEKVQKLYNDLATEISARMAQLTHVTLHAALEQAVKNDLIIRNVTKLTTLPKRNKKEPRVLTNEEQHKFTKACAGSRLEAAFILDLFTGLRRGELLGLHWKETDLKKKVIKVMYTLNRVKNFDSKVDAKTTLDFNSPKTEKGKRIVPLLDNVAAILKTHKIRQEAEKLKVGAAYNNNDLVFCTELGSPLDPRTFTKVFQSVVKKSGIEDANLHCLRHTFATRGLENGIELKVMQELLGHSCITVTSEYSHVLQDKKREAIDKLKNVYKATSK